ENGASLAMVSAYRDPMSTTPAPSQAQIEAAVEQTLVGWGAELDAGQKFWWMDWNRMIRDAITAMRTGEPVLYDDDE
ncbi:MAG: hypothetical protein WCC60_03565, partial [Ilumatobacteraceae bacterium]